MLALSFRMSMNGVLRGTVSAAELCCSLLPMLMTRSGSPPGYDQRLDADGRHVADPERMLLREVRGHTPRLRHGQRQQLRQLHDLVERLRLVDLVADDEQRPAGVDQQLCRALHLHRVRPHAHPRVHLIVADDLGREPLLGEIGVPVGVGRPIRRRPRHAERAADRVGNHLGPARHPGQLRHRRGELVLAGQLLEAVASGRERVLRAVRVEDERCLLLPCVEHLAERVGQSDGAGRHDDGRLSGGLHVAGRHRGARALVRRQDVLELRTIQERVVEVRVLAGRIAEDVLDARGDELLGERLATGTLKQLDGFRRDRRCTGCLAPRLRSGQGDRADRVEDRVRGGGGHAGSHQAAHEIAPRYPVRQQLRDQVSHCGPLTRAR